MKRYITHAALLLITASVHAVTYLSDDFDDGNADGWVEISMIDYEVVDGWYYFHGGYQENHGISYSGDDEGFMSVPDYSTRCRMVLETGYFIGMLIRFREDAEYNLMLVLCPPEQELRLYSWHWSGLILLDHVSFSLNYEEEYWIRAEVDGDVFRGKAWQGLPGDEPSSWMVTSQDSSVTWPGSLGLFCVGISSDGKASLSGRFDDVVITDPIASALEECTWGFLKRFCSIF